MAPSGVQSSGSGRKHIHFNEQVEQRIISGMRGPDDSVNNSSKTFAILPPTTLKCWEELPRLRETTRKHSNIFQNGSRSSLSTSQETIQILRPSTRRPLQDEGDDDVDVDWQTPSLFTHQASIIATPAGPQNSYTSDRSSTDGRPSWMSRTRSETTEVDVDVELSEGGLFDKAIDMLTGVKDMALAIWAISFGGGGNEDFH
jgi:hypothetical protein